LGIDDYDYPNQLQNAVNDAEDLKDKIVEVLGWSSNDIDLVLDEDAECSDIYTAVTSMSKGTDDVNLFFFNGHGEDDSPGGMVPYDIENVITPSNFQSWFGDTYNSFVSIHNSCYSGYFADQMTRGVILTAGTYLQPVNDNGPEAGNSVYAYYLLDALEDRNADPYVLISAEELHDYVDGPVHDWTYADQSRYNNDPQKEDNYTGDLILESVDTPSNLTITNNDSAGQNPHLTWNAPDSVDTYKIYRSISGWQYITSTSNTYYDDNGIIMSSTGEDDKIQYKVTAVFDGKESSPSNIATTWGTDDIPKITVQPDETNLPSQFNLNQNYPNPFNPITTISYHIPENAHVKITVYNMRGQVVANLVNNEMTAGYYSVTWNALDQPSGIYFCKMETRGYVSVKKLTLVK